MSDARPGQAAVNCRGVDWMDEVSGKPAALETSAHYTLVRPEKLHVWCGQKQEDIAQVWL